MRKLFLVLAVVFLVWAMLGCDLFLPPTDDTNRFADVDAMWFTGTVGPSPSQGVDGDLYMNTATGEIFVKLAGTWTSSGDVTGPEGPEGPPGTPVFEMKDHVVLASEVVEYWSLPQAEIWIVDDFIQPDNYWYAFYYLDDTDGSQFQVVPYFISGSGWFDDS